MCILISFWLIFNINKVVNLKNCWKFLEYQIIELKSSKTTTHRTDFVKILTILVIWIILLNFGWIEKKLKIIQFFFGEFKFFEFFLKFWWTPFFSPYQWIWIFFSYEWISNLEVNLFVILIFFKKILVKLFFSINLKFSPWTQKHVLFLLYQDKIYNKSLAIWFKISAIFTAFLSHPQV